MTRAYWKQYFRRGLLFSQSSQPGKGFGRLLMDGLPNAWHGSLSWPYTADGVVNPDYLAQVAAIRNEEKRG